MRNTGLLLILAVSFAACSVKASHAPAATSQPATAATGTAAVNKMQTVEVACGSCVYHMEGVKGCKLAAMVDGKPMLVTGVPQPGHDSGICEKAQQASLTGQVEGGQFVASSFTLKP